MPESRWSKKAAALSQCLRIAGACAFVSMLGLIVVDPFNRAAGISSSCQIEQTPATLVMNGQSQTSAACAIAMSATQ